MWCICVVLNKYIFFLSFFSNHAPLILHPPCTTPFTLSILTQIPRTSSPFSIVLILVYQDSWIGIGRGFVDRIGWVGSSSVTMATKKLVRFYYTKEAGSKTRRRYNANNCLLCHASRKRIKYFAHIIGGYLPLESWK